MAMNLEIIYRDENLIAINKPHGLLVHRSQIANDAKEFSLQILRNQIGRKVYPCHRIDRKTSGVLLFALNENSNSEVQKLFAENKIKKRYLAIVRGYTDDKGTINYPLKRDDGVEQNSVTIFKTLGHTELNLPFLKHQTSRYSLVEIWPQTGRMHQIRKHFAHIFHPIIGDRPYGCNKQNKLFKEKWNMTSLMLHAESIEFKHPLDVGYLKISAPLSNEFTRMKEILELSDIGENE
ncbi:MAG: tRNA pseudouridine(65) synthase TruC [Bacteroidales bacterium]|nr:tRNA pseudouridine(65) synthase TruC [Bacteroidales bacterium]